MQEKKSSSVLKPILSSLALSVLSLQALALPYAPGKIYHPIQYKPQIPHLLPSGLSPQQVGVAYGYNLVSAQGAGQTIAIVDAFDHPYIIHDLTIFNRQFGLPACNIKNGCFKKIYAGNHKPATNAGWAGEIALDVEWAHAMAPRAKIILVEAASDNTDDLYKAVDVAVGAGANIVSMSWGSREFAGQTEYDKIFNNPSVLFVASSGDSGTGVSYPASSPFVLAVGGTSLSVDSFGNYQSETAWSGSSGGQSTIEALPDYQSKLSIPQANNMRGIPDVAYNADPESGFSVYNSVPGEGGNGWQVVGGTSAGAPQWAAILAIIKSAVNDSSALNIDTLYGLAEPSISQYYYNDILSGTNGDCGFYCTAQQGYDYVTGLGSPETQFISGVISLLSSALR